MTGQGRKQFYRRRVIFWNRWRQVAGVEWFFGIAGGKWFFGIAGGKWLAIRRVNHSPR